MSFSFSSKMVISWQQSPLCLVWCGRGSSKPPKSRDLLIKSLLMGVDVQNEDLIGNGGAGTAAGLGKLKERDKVISVRGALIPPEAIGRQGTSVVMQLWFDHKLILPFSQRRLTCGGSHLFSHDGLLKERCLRVNLNMFSVHGSLIAWHCDNERLFGYQSEPGGHRQCEHLGPVQIASSRAGEHTPWDLFGSW